MPVGGLQERCPSVRAKTARICAWRRVRSTPRRKIFLIRIIKGMRPSLRTARTGVILPPDGVDRSGHASCLISGPGTMETDVRRNPALLKLDLYCKGLRLDESCTAQKEGRPILRTRAGLGSGLELILPGGLWTNVPVTEAFARTSP